MVVAVVVDVVVVGDDDAVSESISSNVSIPTPSELWRRRRPVGDEVIRVVKMALARAAELEGNVCIEPETEEVRLIRRTVMFVRSAVDFVRTVRLPTRQRVDTEAQSSMAVRETLTILTVEEEKEKASESWTSGGLLTMSEEKNVVS